ncbi:hypothetical protein GCM10010361_15490 [Streptomyces olivaceiscleroticus]|uniref:Tox-REase-3 domain-containing protein n=1 Tax=Streptomyces olivaceiscleroticus TaxID=68245 RepID=A0ABN0ZM03_9ACTN
MPAARWISSDRPDTVSGQPLGKAFRKQAQATFKMAKATERVPYFQFDGPPEGSVVDAIRRYSQRYKMPAVIDTEVLPVG